LVGGLVWGSSMRNSSIFSHNFYIEMFKVNPVSFAFMERNSLQCFTRLISTSLLYLSCSIVHTLMTQRKLRPALLPVLSMRFRLLTFPFIHLINLYLSAFFLLFITFYIIFVPFRSTRLYHSLVTFPIVIPV